MTLPAQVLVIGTGPAGMAAALALAATGIDTVLAGPSPAVDDRRTAALLSGSIALLQRLGAWEDCRAHAAPITGIRIVDATGGLVRAPEVLFAAADAGVDVFGWNVPNGALAAALHRRAQNAERLRIVETQRVVSVQPSRDDVTLRTHEGASLTVKLCAGADGRNSIARAAAGIGSIDRSYPQSALVTSFGHGRAHRGISTELHHKAGPLTVVPLPGGASSLVWVERPHEAERLAGLDDDVFRATLEERLQGLLGSIGEVAPRRLFPLSARTAERFAGNRVALIGEAAHVIPPIGAQGLNLGLRDAATLADIVADAIARGGDPGVPDTLAAYDAARRGDIESRTRAVDVLNRTLISDLIPADLARGFGLHLLKAIAPLRRATMREGLHPSGPVPRLMRPSGA